MTGPSPDLVHPLPGFEEVTFIKNVIKNPNIIVGDYSYYYDSEDSVNFERNVLFHYPFIGDKLIIGKFCVINRGTIFIMNGAGISSECVSMFPFYVFANGWEKHMPHADDLTTLGDTIIHNDVWLGADCVIMPGIEIGNGAVVATRAVVTENVEPYTVVAGNPAQVIKKRFSEDTIEMLLRLRWWDWPTEKISQYINVLNGGNTFALSQLYALSILDVHPFDSQDFLSGEFGSSLSFSSSGGKSASSPRSGSGARSQIDFSKLSSFIAASSGSSENNFGFSSDSLEICPECLPDFASEYARRADEIDNCSDIDESDFNVSESLNDFGSNDFVNTEAREVTGDRNSNSLIGAVRSAIKKMVLQDDSGNSFSDYPIT